MSRRFNEFLYQFSYFWMEFRSQWAQAHEARFFASSLNYTIEKMGFAIGSNRWKIPNDFLLLCFSKTIYRFSFSFNIFQRKLNWQRDGDRGTQSLHLCEPFFAPISIQMNIYSRQYRYIYSVQGFPRSPKTWMRAFDPSRDYFPGWVVLHSHAEIYIDVHRSVLCRK